ncbi:helix-turn-helix domain-containing protein [Patescibacteria group bacterium]
MFNTVRKNLTSGRQEDKPIDFDSLPQLLTLEQVSEFLGVHPNTLRNWDANGKLRAVRVGKRRDRRYDKKDVRILYLAKNGLDDVQQEPEVAGDEPKKELAPVKKPVFNWSMVHLVIAALFLHVAVAANDTPGLVLGTQIEMYRLEPANCTGWTNAEHAKRINALSTSALSDFNEGVSAYYSTSKLFPVEDDMAESLQAPVSDIVCSGYLLPEDVSTETVPEYVSLNEARVLISMGAKSFKGNEDVLSFSYSLDGQTWIPLDSFGILDEMSNSTHEGYWAFPIRVDSFEEISQIQVKADYNAVPAIEESLVYVDGIIIEADIGELDKTSKNIVDSVKVEKRDYDVSENPVVSIDVEERSALSFIGIGTTERTVKEATLTRPDGTQKIVALEEKEVQEGDIKRVEYSVSKDELARGGEYELSFSVEQDGEVEIVTKSFSWGVLAINPDQSVYRPGDLSILSIGVLDDKGGIVCDADIELLITDPNGKILPKMTTENGGIAVSDKCHIKDIYFEPDYSAYFRPKISGTYNIQLTATHVNGTHTISQ